MSYSSIQALDSFVIISGTTQRVLADFASGDYLLYETPNDLSETAIGRGGTVHVKNFQGLIRSITIRLLKGSPDDVFMNDLFNDYARSTTTFSLLSAIGTKLIASATGNRQQVFYLSSGIPKRLPTDTASSEGNTDQAITIYELDFREDNKVFL